MPHLTCETNFLPLFVFLISSILYHHLALDRLSTFLVAFVLKHTFSHSLFLRLNLIFTARRSYASAVIKLSFSHSLFLRSRLPFLALISRNYDYSSFSSHWRYSIDKCGRLSQPSWLLLRTVIQSYLLTYLRI